MPQLHKGRRPAVHTRRTMHSALIANAHLSDLGTAPAVCRDFTAAVKVPWGMMLNDDLGCCVCSDTAHMLMLRSANTNKIVVPTDADVEYLYEKVGKYNPGASFVDGANPTDQGCVETDMCNYLETTGFIGHKADAVCSVEPTMIDNLKWGINLFGGVRLGLNLPKYAMPAFEAGRSWDKAQAGDDASSDGGHDVPIVLYASDIFYCITWGKLQAITSDFIREYCDEAHIELFFDWVQDYGLAPSGFNLSQLAQDLQSLSAPA